MLVPSDCAPSAWLVCVLMWGPWQSGVWEDVHAWNAGACMSDSSH
jgi:hypothetical protein